jgi:hypothetical protein
VISLLPLHVARIDASSSLLAPQWSLFSHAAWVQPRTTVVEVEVTAREVVG